jgi:hypothetical protein
MLLGLLPLAGCKPAKEVVYVDLDRVAAQEIQAPAQIDLGEPMRPQVVSPKTVTLPGAPAQVIRFENVESIVREARARVRESQQRAYDEMRENLARVYEAQATIQARELRSKTDEGMDAMIASALAALDEVFQTYATRRGDPLARLFFLRTQDPTRKGISEEIAQREQEIRTLDEEFDKRASEIFGAVDDELARRRAEIEKQVAAVFARFRASAEEDARAFTQEVSTEIQSKLSGHAPVSLPAQAGRTMRIDGAPPLEPPPAIAATGRNVLQERLRQDLDIWLAARNLELGSKTAPDRTQEFIRWRRSFEAGH